jgi:phosphohistidine phosphatase
MSASRVYLVRHAKAEGEHPLGDAARRLTAEGRESFELLAREMGGAMALTRILSSPFARALETAHLLADVTGAAVEQDDALASGRCSAQQLLDLATSAGAGAGIAIVGHNPEIQEAIALASGREQAVPAGTIAAVELGEGGAARLVWIAAPGRAG